MISAPSRKLKSPDHYLTGVLAVLLFCLGTELLARPDTGLIGGLGTALFIALLVWWLSIGPHIVLRFWLWRTNSLPWNVVPFLDEAAERLLLRKVDSSYTFVHRLLLDYFATLDESEFLKHLDEKRTT